jgi:hypothetical protein
MQKTRRLLAGDGGFCIVTDGPDQTWGSSLDPIR